MMRWLIILFLFATGCPAGICTPNDTRCTDTNVAEICSGDGEWLTMLDCGDLGEPGWACCRTESGCTCLPVGDTECLP